WMLPFAYTKRHEPLPPKPFPCNSRAALSALPRRASLRRRHHHEQGVSALRARLRARTGLFPRRHVRQLWHLHRRARPAHVHRASVVPRCRSRRDGVDRRGGLSAVRADGVSLLARGVDALRSLGVAGPTSREGESAKLKVRSKKRRLSTLDF